MILPERTVMLYVILVEFWEPDPPAKAPMVANTHQAGGAPPRTHFIYVDDFLNLYVWCYPIDTSALIMLAPLASDHGRRVSPAAEGGSPILDPYKDHNRCPGVSNRHIHTLYTPGQVTKFRSPVRATCK